MNKKPGFFQKAEKVLAGKGFYMVLLLCLVILGASGYYLYRTVNSLTPVTDVSGSAEVVVTSPKREETAVSPVEDVEISSPAEETAELPSDVLQPVSEPVEDVEAAAPAEAQPVVQTVEEVPTAETAPALGWPVEGEIVAAFSASELTYNEAMGDWRTHSGIDIAAGLGTEVLAAADGAVESIANNPLTGTTLTLTHAGGITTIYGNLDPDTLNVAEGDAVTAGQSLACVGSSAAGESNEGSFLHFAVKVDGVSADPAEYLN